MSALSNNFGQTVFGYFTYLPISAQAVNPTVPATSSNNLQPSVALKKSGHACSYCRHYHLRCDNKDSTTRCMKAFMAQMRDRRNDPCYKNKQFIPGSGVIRAKRKPRSQPTSATPPILPQTIFGPLRIQDLLNTDESIS